MPAIDLARTLLHGGLYHQEPPVTHLSRLALVALVLAALTPSTASSAEPIRERVAAPRLEEPAASAPSRPARPTELRAGEVKAGIDMKTGRVRACYERVLKGEPGLAGSMLVGFTIRADGAVVDVAVIDDRLRRASVTSCVLGVVESLRFRRSASALDVEFPFGFRPQW